MKDIKKKQVFYIEPDKYFESENEAIEYLNKKLINDWIHRYCDPDNGMVMFQDLEKALIDHVYELRCLMGSG